jgi:hypothetical protein
VWGGMTERERRALLRSHPSGSWRAVLEQAANRGDRSTPRSDTPRQDAATSGTRHSETTIRIGHQRRAAALRTR